VASVAAMVKSLAQTFFGSATRRKIGAPHHDVTSSLKLSGKILPVHAGPNAVLQPVKLFFPLVGPDVFDVLCIVHCRVRHTTADLAQSVNRHKAVG
jgi:hypothetical protein